MKLHTVRVNLAIIELTPDNIRISKSNTLKRDEVLRGCYRPAEPGLQCTIGGRYGQTPWLNLNKISLEWDIKVSHCTVWSTINHDGRSNPYPPVISRASLKTPDSLISSRPDLHIAITHLSRNRILGGRESRLPTYFPSPCPTSHRHRLRRIFPPFHSDCCRTAQCENNCSRDSISRPVTTPPFKNPNMPKMHG